MGALRGEVALSELLAHADWLRRLASRLVRDPHEADDAVQDTWLAALHNAPPRADSSRGWLAAILRNVVRQRARSDTARRSREQLAARSEVASTAEDSVERAQGLRGLVGALLELDEPYRSTLLLHFQDGLASAEIARLQGVPESTVRNRLRRGVALLRERYERKHGANWALLLAPLSDWRLSVESAPLAATTSTSTAVPLLGLVAMNKVIAVAAVAVFIAALVWWNSSDSATPPSTNAAAPERPELSAPAQLSVSVTAPSETTERAEVPAPVEIARPSTATLSVRVVWDEDSTPAADVGLHVLSWRSPNPLLVALDLITDADGIALVEDLPPGKCTAYSDRGGSASAEIAAGETREVEIRIENGIDVDGLVVDSNDRTVADARIWLSGYGNPSQGQEVARTDASGRFELRDVGEARHVAARADGYAPSFGYGVPGRAGDRVEMKLVLPARGGWLRGVVRTFDGQPAAGARILFGADVVASHSDDDGRAVAGSPPVRLRSDAQGTFKVDGLAAGRVLVAARTLDSAPWRDFVDITAERMTTLEIMLENGASIAGTLTQADGAPASAVFVGVGPYADFASTGTNTSSDGSFLLSGLEPGETAVRADGRERGRARATLITVAGEVTRWDAQLEVNETVGGRVVDERGAPLAGFRVGAIKLDHPGLHHRTCITDQDGVFNLENWPAEAEALEVREADRWVGPACATETDVRRGSLDHVLRVPDAMRASSFIVGRVLGPDGKPVREGTVDIWPKGTNRSLGADVSADTGEFRGGPMPSGEYRVEVKAAGLGELQLGVHRVSNGETLDLGEWRFDTPGRIRVLLTPSAGCEPPERAHIGILRPDGSNVERIELEGQLAGRSAPIAPGAYFVVLSYPADFRSARTPIEVAAGAEVEVEITLERAAYRVFDATWTAGSPGPASVDWTVTDAQGREHSTGAAMRDAATHIAFVRDLAPGRFTLVMRADDGRWGQLEFEVADFTPSHERLQIELAR